MGRIINPWGNHFFIDKTILVAMPKRILFFLIVPLLWTAGCEILGKGGGYECEPPPCPPNANCLIRCGDLFIANAEGGGALNLTHSVRGEGGPVWSPDGSEIAFIEEAGIGLWAISVMTRSGGNRRRLTKPGSYGNLTWSPDGARLAYNSDGVLHIINADGTGEKRLTTASHSLRPRWSPNGRQILFFSVIEGPWTLNVIDADGTKERRLAPTLRNITTADWSPDGSRIAFSGNNKNEPSEIYIINVDGSGLTRVSKPGFSRRDPRWSPDGQQIAYRGGGLWLMEADGSNRRVLVDGHIGEMDWSPNGKTLVYSSYQETGYALYLFDIESQQKRFLADVPTQEYDLQWSPDGSWILFGG